MVLLLLEVFLDPQLVNLIKKGIEHKGFSFIDILSPCVIHNKTQDYPWYRENIINFDQDPHYDFKNRRKVWERINTAEKIPTGLIFVEEKPSWEELILEGRKTISSLNLYEEKYNYEELMKKFI